MIHQTFVWWALYTLYILFKFVQSLIRHLGLASGNVRCVRWFSWTLQLWPTWVSHCLSFLSSSSGFAGPFQILNIVAWYLGSLLDAKLTTRSLSGTAGLILIRAAPSPTLLVSTCTMVLNFRLNWLSIIAVQWLTPSFLEGVKGFQMNGILVVFNLLQEVSQWHSTITWVRYDWRRVLDYAKEWLQLLLCAQAGYFHDLLRPSWDQVLHTQLHNCSQRRRLLVPWRRSYHHWIWCHISQRPEHISFCHDQLRQSPGPQYHPV